MGEDWKNKRVLVVGMARSGVAAAGLLCAQGALPVLSDSRPDKAGLDTLIAMGCQARLGEMPETLVDGCDAVVVSPAVPMDAPVVRRAQALHVPVLGELELAARFVRGTQVAVTGTNGKTTTVSLTGEMLRNAGRRAFVAGNIGLALSGVALETREEDVCVIEVSSFQLETVDRFHPHVAALLNLTPDHLNRHGTMEAYGALKSRITERQEARDFFVYNADDPFCAQVASQTRAQAVPFSRLTPQETGAWVENEQILVEGRALCGVDALSLPGPHNLENALAASAMASCLGVPAPVIRHTLRTFSGVEHRMESVRVLDGVRYINDSKGTNPDASIRAVEGMTVPTVLIAGGDEKGTSFDGFARAIRANPNIRSVVLMGKTAGKIGEALERAGYSAYQTAGYDLEKAVRLARQAAERGGAVLLSPACASFDMFSDYEERGKQFKRIVNALA